MVNLFKNWISNEDGFEVFEKFGLTQGGVLLALGVVAVAMFFMSGLWNEVGDAIGSGEDSVFTGMMNAPQAIGTDTTVGGWIQ